MGIDDVDDDIRAAIAQNEEAEIVVADAPAEVVEAEPTEPPKDEKRNERGQFKAKSDSVKPITEVIDPVATVIAEPTKPAIEAPTFLSPAIKAKWGALPNDVQAEWAKRETEIHNMFTRHDGDLRVGREMKEVINPYLATIRAEGGTPAKAVESLLNTAYQLRTASPQQKAATVRQIIKDYGVDPTLLQGEEEYQDPTVSALQNEINQLKTQFSPDAIKKQLQEQMESTKISSEVEAFASDPANIHYEQVKPIMATLLGSGQAGDLKEAYDMACYTKPEIRAALLAKQSADEAAKRKNDLASKKKAGVSVTGSPGASSTPTAKSDNSVEDDVREAFRAASGRI